MASTSSHLHLKSYVVFTTNKEDVPLRQWHSHGTWRDVSPRSAMFQFVSAKAIGITGDPIETSKEGFPVYSFPEIVICVALQGRPM